MTKPTAPGPGEHAVTVHGVVVRPPNASYPYYRLDYRLGGKRRQPNGTREFAVAWAKAQQIDRLIAADSGDLQAMPVSALVDEWRKVRTDPMGIKPWSTSYLEIVEQVTKRSIAPHMGPVACGKLHPRHVRNAIGAAPTPSTRAQALTVISSLVHFGYREEWIPRVPKVLIPERAQVGVRPIEDHESPATGDVDAVLAHASPLLVLPVLLGCGLGLRQGEVFAGKGDQVLADGRFHVTRQVLEPNGGGHLETLPKYRRKRHVVIPTAVLGFPLLQMLTDRAQEVGPSGLLCPAAKGSWWWKGVFNDRLAEAGPWKFHAFRHYYCRSLLDLGVQPADLAAMAGHKSVKTTLDLYVGRTAGVEERVRDKVG